MNNAAAFDSFAADYDRSFTTSAIGQRLRAAVWRRLDAAFRPGDRVLELNCGTGEDAVYLGRRGVHVLTTDISTEMLTVTRAKVTAAISPQPSRRRCACARPCRSRSATWPTISI